jgi:hypothetical protein
LRDYFYRPRGKKYYADEVSRRTAPPHLRAIHVGAVGEIEHLVFLKKAGAVIEDSKIEDDEEITSRR